VSSSLVSTKHPQLLAGQVITCVLKLVSLSSTPAMKAPRVSLIPSSDVMSEVPTTVRRQRATNVSLLRDSATS